MARKARVKILRGTRSNISNSDVKLEKGELLLDTDDGYLFAGLEDGVDANNTSNILKAREVIGYANDSATLNGSVNPTDKKYSFGYNSSSDRVGIDGVDSLSFNGDIDIHKNGASNSIKIGSGITTDQGYSVAIGGNVRLGKTGDSACYSIAIGYQAKANDSFAVSIGTGSDANNSSVAIGVNSKASNNNSVAIGSNSEASGLDSIVIGNTSKSSGQRSVSIGDGSNASGGFSISIGRSSNASGAFNSMAIGYESNSSGVYSVALGSRANSSSSESIAIGNGAKATASKAVQIGNGSNGNASTLQFLNKTISNGSALFGPFEGDLTGNVTGNVTGDLTGNVSNASSIDFLTGVDINGSYVRIGRNTSTTSPSDVAIGNGAYASKSIASASVAIGKNANAFGSDSIAIGNCASVAESATNAAQIGAGTNSKSGTLQFRDKTIANSNGVIITSNGLTSYRSMDSESSYPNEAPYGSLLYVEVDSIDATASSMIFLPSSSSELPMSFGFTGFYFDGEYNLFHVRIKCTDNNGAGVKFGVSADDALNVTKYRYKVFNS